jgi:molybdopterin converting factor small subunit
MAVTVQIPTPLRRFTAENGEVEVEASNVGEALRALVDLHPSLEPHLYGENGKLRTFVNLFLNDEDVRYLQQEGTAVSGGDVLSIIPSIAGGGDEK